MAPLALDPAYRRVDVEEFLDMNFGDAKAELDNGLIYMMSGGSEAHARIAVNLVVALGVRLRGSGCRPYNSNFAVRTGERSVRYPDVSVYCDNPAAPENRDKRLLGDPRVIFEVLSPATSSLDQTVKRDEYLALPGVTDIVFVDPVRQRIRHVRRTGDEWLEAGSDLIVASLDLTIPHGDIFADD